MEEYMRLVKDKNSGIRLMGFRHRVYKSFDPRAQMLQRVAEKLLAHLQINDPLLEIGRRLEDIALNDPYFVDRKLYPNVDFYSGIILRALGFPTKLICSRLYSQWVECQAGLPTGANRTSKAHALGGPGRYIRDLR